MTAKITITMCLSLLVGKLLRALLRMQWSAEHVCTDAFAGVICVHAGTVEMQMCRMPALFISLRPLDRIVELVQPTKASCTMIVHVNAAFVLHIFTFICRVHPVLCEVPHVM